MNEKQLLERIKQIEAEMHKKVRFKAFKTRKDTGDLYVGVAGYNAIIPRGKEVIIPRYAAEVLEQSFDNDLVVMENIEKLTKKASAKELN